MSSTHIIKLAPACHINFICKIKCYISPAYFLWLNAKGLYFYKWLTMKNQWWILENDHQNLQLMKIESRKDGKWIHSHRHNKKLMSYIPYVLHSTPHILHPLTFLIISWFHVLYATKQAHVKTLNSVHLMHMYDAITMPYMALLRMCLGNGPLPFNTHSFGQLQWVVHSPMPSFVHIIPSIVLHCLISSCREC